MEALMTKLAAAIRPSCWPRITRPAGRLGNGRAPRELDAPSVCAPPFFKPRDHAISACRLANSLEFPSTAFHYSVIGPSQVAGRPATKTFNSVQAASSLDKAVPLQMHKEMIDGPPPRTTQFRFRTGDRKINAKGFETGSREHGQSHAHQGLLMRLVKNIHATLPSYATIAPILHAQHVTPAQRGITLNIGAADATGR
jgi:hypothetical protein